MQTPIFCPRVVSFEMAFIPSLLRSGEMLSLQQTWLSEPDPRFLPGRVWMGWQPSGFLIWAELDDQDIFNPVETFNQPAFLKGDVFEIFLKPQGSDAYYEFHISPRNQVFQYGIPSAEDLYEQRGKGIQPEWLIQESVIESEVEIDRLQQQWRISAGISLKPLGLPALKAGDQWTFSFCRYDYSQGSPKPVHSSCSELKKLDFHDQTCWNTLELG